MLSINLLPPENILAGKRDAKILLANRIGLWLFVALIFFTSVTLSLRILQNLKLKQLTGNVAEAQTKVISLKDKEGAAVLLKQRLSLIESLRTDSNKLALFNLFIGLAPADVVITSTSINRSGDLEVSAIASSLTSVEQLFNGLNNPERTSNLVSRVDLSSFSLGRDGGYRFTVNISSK